MYTLGLNAYHGDSSACIFHHNELLVATEEERIRRIKHWAGLPTEAVKFCLEEAGITLAEVDVTLSMIRGIPGIYHSDTSLLLRSVLA